MASSLQKKPSSPSETTPPPRMGKGKAIWQRRLERKQSYLSTEARVRCGEEEGRAQQKPQFGPYSPTLGWSLLQGGSQAFGGEGECWRAQTNCALGSQVTWCSWGRITNANHPCQGQESTVHCRLVLGPFAVAPRGHSRVLARSQTPISVCPWLDGGKALWRNLELSRRGG